MKHLRTTAVLLGLAAYTVVFFATPLPSICGSKGPLLRIEVLGQLLLLPDELLFSNWFGVPPGFSLLDRLPVLLTAAAIWAWAAVLGWSICRDRFPRLETAVFSLGLGLSLLSTWVLLLGLFGLMDRLWMVDVPAALTLVVAYASYRRGRRAPPPVVQPPAEADAGLALHWLWLGAPFVLAILLAGMLPPLDFDVREYHLQAPKEFFEQGRIVFLPHNVYANMPLGAEMLSLLAMVLTGDWWLGALAGKTVIAVFTPLTALTLLAAGRRFFSTTAGIVAALLYISIPWIVSVTACGLVESALAFYLFAAVYALMLWNDASGASQTPLQSQKNAYPQSPVFCLALAGYFAGAAVAVKYPAVLFVLLPMAFWVLVRGQGAGDRGQGTGNRGRGTGGVGRETGWPSRNADSALCFQPSAPCPLSPVPSSPSPAPSSPSPDPLPSTPVPLAVFLLAAAIACGPWFAKNWLLTGNPTYPLLYSTFGGQSWNAQKDRQWNQVHRPHDFSASTLGRDVGRVLLTSEWLSPLIVPLAALAFVGGCARPRMRWTLLAYFWLVVALWWLLTHRIDRFWIPMLPIAAMLAGVGACWNPHRWWRWCLIAMLVVGLGANFLVAGMERSNAWFVPLAKLRRAPGWIDPWHAYFNAQASEGRVLCVGDAAPFDFTVPVLYNTCFDDCIFQQLVEGKTPSQIRAAFAAQRIAYVYVDWGEIARYRNSYGFTDFVQPGVFDRLVAEGVLKPLPPIKDHPGRAYRVR